MALTNPTKLSDFAGFIKPDQAGYIFERAARLSVVQRVVPQVTLGPSGLDVPVVTGKMTASWVGEAAQKPSSAGSVGLKTIKPAKIAALTVVSAEVLRLDPASYLEQIRPQIAEAFAKAFDDAALHGTNTPFTTYIAQTTKTAALGTANANGGNGPANGGTYQDLVGAMSQLVTDGKLLSNYLLDDITEPTMLGSVDTAGRPLWIEGPFDETVNNIREGRVLGRRSLMAQGVKAATPVTPATSYTVGFAGDFSQAAWGVVGGINYRTSTEAAVTLDGELVSLFENNLVAILAEAEYGFLVNDPQSFVELTFKTAP